VLSAGNTETLCIMPSYKYPLLNDESWLREQYFDKGLSTVAIGEMVQVKDCNSVRQALLRFGITPRNWLETRPQNNSHEEFILDMDVINGCMLGDGYMRKFNKSSKISLPYFTKKNKFLDHVQYVASFLFDEPNNFITSGVSKCLDKEFPIYQLRGHTDERLTEVYEKWYPASNNYKKIVPFDLELNERILLHWFMDDGSSYRRHGYGRRSKQIVISFACESFTKEEQEFLAQQMFDKWGLRINVRYYRIGSDGSTQYRMHLAQSQSDLFFSIIGPPPVPSLAYKWK